MPAIIDCKAFLKSAPLKAKFKFQVVSPEGMLELLEDEPLLLAEELLALDEELALLEELDCWLEELLLCVDEAEELESSEAVELFELSSTLVMLVVLSVLDPLMVLLGVCELLKQLLNTKAKAARIIGILLFFIGLYYIATHKIKKDCYVL